jgi:hypothetical protein
VRLLAIDPGPEKSAIIHYNGNRRCIEYGEILDNESLLVVLGPKRGAYAGNDPLVIEWIHHMGMAAGAELFDTARWVGRFQEAWLQGEARPPVTLLPRRDIKLAICGSARATDANIRQALIDRFGGKEKAIGTKRVPGPLYAIKSHLWSALAVAVAYTEIYGRQQEA